MNKISKLIAKLSEKLLIDRVESDLGFARALMIKEV